MIEDRTIARTTAQVVVEVSKYLNAMLRKRISSVVARMIAMRPVKNNFNSAWVSVCAQAAEDQRAPPAANTNMYQSKPTLSANPAQTQKPLRAFRQF